MVTVVDARNLGRQLHGLGQRGGVNEAVLQIAHADVVILNKVDLVENGAEGGLVSGKGGVSLGVSAEESGARNAEERVEKRGGDSQGRKDGQGSDVSGSGRGSVAGVELSSVGAHGGERVGRSSDEVPEGSFKEEGESGRSRHEASVSPNEGFGGSSKDSTVERDVTELPDGSVGGNSLGSADAGLRGFRENPTGQREVSTGLTTSSASENNWLSNEGRAASLSPEENERALTLLENQILQINSVARVMRAVRCQVDIAKVFRTSSFDPKVRYKTKVFLAWVLLVQFSVAERVFSGLNWTNIAVERKKDWKDWGENLERTSSC